MRYPPRILVLLVLGAGVAGCTQPGGLRAITPSDVKTTASVGDQPLTVVAGLPGEEGRAETESLKPARSSSTGRISGRVYDDQGEPVRNAVVRLALTGAAGGKAVHATTDRSGAFTLRDLRPGSTYTVIAEYQGEQGMMTGRTEAEAPETGVQISLHPRDSAAAAGVVAAAPAASRARPISRSEAAREEEEFSDDLGVSEEFSKSGRRASASARPRPVRPRLDTADDDRDEPVQGWSAESSSQPVSSADFLDEPREAFETPRDRTPRNEPRDREPIEDLDDGENPLPPAREVDDLSARVDDGEPLNGLLEEAPITARSQAVEENRESRDAAKPVTPAQERSRPTWGDVVTDRPQHLIDEALSQTTATVAAVATAAAPAAVPALNKPSPRAATPPKPQPRPVSTAVKRPTAPYCNFDPDDRRMIDFAEYDVDGKLVSLRDFDADLILLDLWGTWCVPCRTSIPHLKALQDRYGAKKLQVIGIAYEQTPEGKRAEGVKSVMDSLKINYPVLVKGLQDDCPIRWALQAWHMPTLVLLDRQGKIIRREAGATAVTLGNIDRAIAEHFEKAGKPEYVRREPKGRATR